MENTKVVKDNKLIQIKSNRKGWHTVELISINKGGTITIRIIGSGQIVTRKHDKVRWTDVKKVEGDKVTPKMPNKKVKKKPKKSNKKNKDKDNKFSNLEKSWQNNLKKLNKSLKGD